MTRIETTQQAPFVLGFLLWLIFSPEGFAQGTCCGDISAFDNGARIVFGCPGTPSITTDVRVECKDASGAVTSSSTVGITGTGQCQALAEQCVDDYKECSPAQEIRDTSTGSQHSYEIKVLNARVDPNPDETCLPNCIRMTGTLQIKNCPCATCPSSGGGGGGGEEECDNGAAGGAQRLWDAPAIRARSGGGNCEGWDPNTPIIISVRGNQLWLTDLEHGVRFDLDADGFDEALSWTQQGVDDAFLVLDRNGNGQVDEGTELFGTFTPQPPSTNPNGFLALAVFDLADNGGNRDGRISAEDAIFESLQLWVDWNHNGFSEPNELRPLPATRIQAIHLDYRESRRRDQHGNGFRYYSVIDMTPHQQGPRRKFAVDVFLLSDQ